MTLFQLSSKTNEKKLHIMQCRTFSSSRSAVSIMPATTPFRNKLIFVQNDFRPLTLACACNDCVHDAGFFVPATASRFFFLKKKIVQMVRVL
jgi:hypothetical protein